MGSGIVGSRIGENGGISVLFQVKTHVLEILWDAGRVQSTTESYYSDRRIIIPDFASDSVGSFANRRFDNEVE